MIVQRSSIATTSSFDAFLGHLGLSLNTSKTCKRMELKTKQVALILASYRLFLVLGSSSRIPNYWPRYDEERRVELLDGVWQTTRLGTTEDPPVNFDSMNPSFDAAQVKMREVANVPSCVDSELPGYLGYRGVTFYERKFNFNLSESGARLQFLGCSFYCRVWVNGEEVGDHLAGGYVPFTLDIPPQDSTENSIFVLADNRWNATTAPMHTGGDFLAYGGIIRSVEIHSLPPPGKLWPWRAHVIPQSLSEVNIAIQLTDPSVTEPISEIAMSFDDGPVTLLSGIAIDGVVSFKNISVPEPRFWSPDDPQLHVLRIRMNGAVVEERFGLRMIDIDKASLRIRLNGEVLKLVGWNHHTEWPDTSGSPTDAQMDQDMSILKEGGANFVRGAHYPQDPRWLDRLDENGMIMWSETLGPGVKVANMTDPYFLKYQAIQLHQMMDNAMNHPSIAFWAFFNEGDSDIAEGCPAYEMCAEVIKSRDTSRLVTYAARGPPHWDICHETVDVVSINGYPGWYRPQESLSEFWVNLSSYFTSFGKPFLISETGAGGIYEWAHNKTAEKWTLLYQTKIIEQDVEIALSNPNISGISLWHMMDFKAGDQNNTHCNYSLDVYPPMCTYINTSAGYRPGGLNHKGSLDFWRRKKPIFDIVAAKYNETRRRNRAAVGNGVVVEGSVSTY